MLNIRLFFPSTIFSVSVYTSNHYLNFPVLVITGNYFLFFFVTGNSTRDTLFGNTVIPLQLSTE